jgi:hypothetical protein
VTRALLAVAFLIGCGHGLKPPVSPAESAGTVLDMARARPVAEPVRARFGIKISSPRLDVQGATGAALIVSRPQGRVDILGPLGNSIVTFSTDGTRADVVSARDKSHLHADAAEEALREVTEGAAGLGDVLSVLIGDLPFDTAEAKRLDLLDDGSVHVTLDGPGKTALDAILDPALGTVERLEARDNHGDLMLSAEYGAYAPIAEGGPLAPSTVTLFLPALDLTLDLSFKKWEVLPTVDAALFQPLVPEGFSSKSLEEAVLEAASKVGADAVTAPDERP